MFRGREVTHPERGTALLERLAGELSEIGVVEQTPLQDGRNMTMMLAPSKAVLAGEKDGKEKRPTAASPRARPSRRDLRTGSSLPPTGSSLPRTKRSLPRMARSLPRTGSRLPRTRRSPSPSRPRAQPPPEAAPSGLTVRPLSQKAPFGQ